jgi:hypothetical protein
MAGLPQTLPQLGAPPLTPAGIFTPEWVKFFAGLIAVPGPIVPITPTGSPFAYTATQNGNMVVQGGMVSAITITRGTTRPVTVATGVTGGIFPLSLNDELTVTYTGAPTMNFIPSI